jgi:hypothetical protein
MDDADAAVDSLLDYLYDEGYESTVATLEPSVQIQD